MGKSPGQSAGGEGGTGKGHEGLVSRVGSGLVLETGWSPSARERDGRERVVGASENLVGSLLNAGCRTGGFACTLLSLPSEWQFG